MKSEAEIRKHRDDVRKILKECQKCGCLICQLQLEHVVPVEAELTWVLGEDSSGKMDRIVENMSKDASNIPT